MNVRHQERAPRVDNFDRAVWASVGVAWGIAATVWLGGVQAALILGGYQAVWLFILGLLTGRIRLGRRDRA